jgi:hypothetical protein
MEASPLLVFHSAASSRPLREYLATAKAGLIAPFDGFLTGQIRADGLDAAGNSNGTLYYCSDF